MELYTLKSSLRFQYFEFLFIYKRMLEFKDSSVNQNLLETVQIVYPR